MPYIVTRTFKDVWNNEAGEKCVKFYQPGDAYERTDDVKATRALSSGRNPFLKLVDSGIEAEAEAKEIKTLHKARMKAAKKPKAAKKKKPAKKDEGE